ncbi:GntR family transcriptional regulator, partial [Curvivirga aplysinae]|uniref:GntR family transcriptional regulator n=1 Tax=Curvivirga aplysinae TaxID=2529852 RepID=UPI0012BBB257
IMTQNNNDRPANLSQFAYEKIEHAIISAELDFGEPLSENALATALNISKAPVRTALLELQRKGLVDIVPQSGCYVTVPDKEQIRQLLETRVILETNALKIAMRGDSTKLIEKLDDCWTQLQKGFEQEDWEVCQTNDTRFHRSIVQAAGNQYLLDSYDNIIPIMNAMMTRFMLTQTRKNKTLADHPVILNFIREKNLSAANRLLKKHILKNNSFKSAPKWPNRRATRSEYTFRDFDKVFKN